MAQPKPWPGRTRLALSKLIGAGKSVKVTNPAHADAKVARRTPSLGMGGIEQYNKR